MATPKTIAIILLATGTLTLSAGAKVFWARPQARGHAVLETTPDWETVYASSVRINDGQGTLAVIGCHEPLSAVMAKLRQAYAPYETLDAFRQNETVGWARVREAGSIVTLLALAVGAPEQVLLFALTQTPEDFDRSRGPPAAPRLSDPAPFPGSRVQTYLTSEESRVQLEMYSAAALPEAIRTYYESRLLGQAWKCLDPGDSAGAAPASLAVYQKDRALCALLIVPADGNAQSMITVLHKQVNVE